MAQTILIKRSTSSSTPSALANGELAYSAQSNKLFIGRPGGGTGDIDAIGGKYYTDIVDGAASANTASKLVLRDSSGNFSAGTITATLTGNVTGNVTGNTSGTALSVTQAAQTAITSVGTLTALQVDNLNLNGNTFSATTGAVNITPAAGSAIVLDGTINVDAGVVTGATSISSTAFVGTLSTVSQPNVTSVGTLTALQVDNINLNGNVLSSTSGNLSITPVSGSTIVLDGTIIVDAGIVTGATSITSTTFVGALTGNTSILQWRRSGRSSYYSCNRKQ
jgi:trimeric autotransporter adhesin